MGLRKKLGWITAGLLGVLSAVLCIAYYFQAKQQAIGQEVDKARSIVLMAESTREEMGRKWQEGIFTTDRLAQWAKEGKIANVLSAVPVVTAWRAAEAKETEAHYKFKVPKFQPRNPKNEPDAVEARVLKAFESSGATEYFEIDQSANAVRYFRPVRLTTECLACHGDPATSKALWGNDTGHDPTGGPMENWKVGDVHGAFEVVQSLEGTDALIASNVRRASGIVGVLAAIACAFFYWITTWSITRPASVLLAGMKSVSLDVVSAAGQVAVSSQSLSQGATEQAASLEETSASMEEMASMTRRNAEHSQKAVAVMADVDRQVTQSNGALGVMVTSMTAITESSNKVAKIIKTIDDIAFQTNILALNAAVEAARAGDAGLGFAVVADEVRSLAQRSAQAARDTAVLIEESIARSQHGSQNLASVAHSIEEITGSVGTVRTLILEVGDASRQQAQGIDQVAAAITQMEKVTQSTAATAEETAAASEELNAQAETAQDTVGQLLTLIEGASAPTRSAGRGWDRSGLRGARESGQLRQRPVSVARLSPGQSTDHSAEYRKAG